MFTSMKIAFRFLTKGKLQSFMIILGIAIGVSVQIFIGLLSKGLEGSLLSKVAGSATHIAIYSKNSDISNYKLIENKIKTVEGISTICPELNKHAVIKVDDKNSEQNVENEIKNKNEIKSKIAYENEEKKGKREGIYLRGFMLDRMNKLYNMESKIYKGKMAYKDNEVIIGKDLNEKLGVNIGDKVTLLTSDGNDLEVVVTGFYDIGAVKVNSSWVITNLATVQKLTGVGDKINAIEMGLKDPYVADVMAKKLEKILGDKNLKFENWKEQNKMLVSAMSGQKICTIIIQFFVLLATVLSIVSILGISVVQKYRQIGILKAMGTKDGSASSIFLFQAFMLGVLGTLLGVYLNFVYIQEFNKHIVTADGKPIVDIIINKRFILISAGIDIIASTIAAFFPAIKSFKLSPVEVIKNG
ncbi:lipoprotein-releasing system permease protein [Clostridium tetanomorphum]|uniref:ABC transporter permease n=2 Tax=Clostridium tetanomorphum TaxID=1553 RepID=UPI00055280CD|nr:FtsX-like permease family protein [Clostridium tetanomorphum]MBP1863038.1 lipoprotein-releasing system permease protein [Clostridium tetanomorphum]NRS82867.1 lipoprotein-releasing system permease protein [Clostridium tetanomorphum]SQC03233.1 ABC-type transport system, involved in lipoprotein release, permease component [Clostridium tetanomorphum]